MKVGILPFGRSTFDISFANEKLALMVKRLKEAGYQISGSAELLFDANSARLAIAQLQGEALEAVLILQVTFTDASMTVEVATKLDLPLAIWAIPEPRVGGRLRLNSLCGLNLASHALGLENTRFSWLYADPDSVSVEQIRMLLSGGITAVPVTGHKSRADPEPGVAIRDSISKKRIGCIGKHPEGFHTCAYSKQQLKSLANIEVDELELQQLFAKAAQVDVGKLAAVHEAVAAQLPDLDLVDAEQLDRSLRLKVALEEIRESGSFDAFAIRCWPEAFTEYGGAVCGPVAMMGEGGVPCACEADVYGALTQLLLQEASGAPVFLTDLVDMDDVDDTAVIWHCGQAPFSMCAPSAVPSATIHTNRKMPLLYQFPLKAGRVTVMRVSQAFGEPKMVLAGAEMLDRPLAFTGTAGVLRFERRAGAVLSDIIASGLEHHMAIAYGEHRPLLRSLAASMNLPIVEL